MNLRPLRRTGGFAAVVVAGLCLGGLHATAQAPQVFPAVPVVPAGLPVPVIPAAPPGPPPAAPLPAGAPPVLPEPTSTPLPAPAPVPPAPVTPAATAPEPAPQPASPAPAAPVDPEVIKRMVADALKEQQAKQKEEEERKRKEDAAKPYEVGSNLGMTGIWDNNLFFITPNKDWRIHVGGRFQFESVFWNQPKSLQGPPPGNGGIPASGRGDGVGPLDDGMFFRRVRLRSDGVGYELVEYTFEVDFEQLNFVTFDHMWVGMKDVPLLGTVRIGQHKVPQGLEMMASDYHQTFLQDRSVLFDAFWTLFAPGIFVSNTLFDNNVTYQTMFHRIQPLGFYTSDFGDGDYAETSRVTWTPVYEDDGACVVHVGGSYQWRHADLGRSIQPGGTGNAFADTQSVVRFRARDELRDGTGVGVILGGNANRFVDTGFLLASNVHTVSPEFMWIQGPFSVQAEAAFAYVQGARQVYPAAALGTPRGTPMFWGGYVETSYFLTGEHRGYDRRFGTFDRPRVSENAFLVRGEDGCWHYGIGAWQVAYRYSYLDLNDNGINGGLMSSHSFGLNWYINDNTKIQFMYNVAHREVAAPAVSGTVQGFGMLTQWYF